MLHVFRNILKFVDHHSFGELLKRLYCAAVKPLYENNARYIFKLNGSSVVDADQTLVIKELGVNDVNKMLEVMYVSRADMEKRFTRGDRCFAVLDKDKIASYFWALSSLRDSCELHLKFKLPSNWAWMYNAITVKFARGRGLYPNIIRFMGKALFQSGIEESFIDVDPKNHSSMRSLEKSGATRVVLIRMKKIISSVSYEIKVFDEDAWKKLSDTIENFDIICKLGW